MIRSIAAVLTIAVGLALSSPLAEVASCAQLLSRGGRIIDTYLMDFGPSDKLYVYIICLSHGRADKCTSQRVTR